ncbi:MAG: hypothetical protein FJZ78_11000 [Bacteroidetes bacterium]|nr:hypothetical protein [Bacteroidota bacterium]
MTPIIKSISCPITREPAKESIPVFVLKKDGANSLSNHLRLCKKLWYGIEEPRRLVGLEAKFLWSLIKDSPILKTEELKYETSFSKLECIRFNSLDFLVWTNSFGDIIIDYPVLANEVEMTISDFEQSVFSKPNPEYHPKP